MTTNRKIVQHGPSTLTVSLPSRWAKRHRLSRGDDIHVEEAEHHLMIRVARPGNDTPKTFRMHGLKDLYPRLLGAIYKLGHDNVILEYGTPDELQELLKLIRQGFIGLEVVEEGPGAIRVQKVSDPDGEEFQVLLRRMCHFLLAIADETLDAARKKDVAASAVLVARDEHINRITDFLRRIVIRHGQHAYRSDAGIYYVVEQLEKCGDAYKHLNQHLARGEPLDDELLPLLGHANALVKKYTQLFWDFKIAKASAFLAERDRFMEASEELAHHRGVHRITPIVQALYDLLGITIMLHLTPDDNA